MSINSERILKRDIALIVMASFVAAHLCFMLMPKVFETWNAQIVDQLFRIRSSIAGLRPAYDATVVHVDINNTAIQHLNNFYLNRAHYARVINNLDAMKASVQGFDVILAARTNEKDDEALIQATKHSGNVYFGMAFSISEREAALQKGPKDKKVLSYLNGAEWKVDVQGSPSGFYTGDHPLITFTDLSACSKGLGFLTLEPDQDGVYRRVPLLVRYNGSFFPSFPFRIVCDYLGVPPDRIVVRPGESITLKGARRPGGRAHDIVIPIDSSGNMVINFAGPWESMKHYSFAEVYRASEDRDEMELWTEQLSGKIVLVSDVSTASNDVGPVPTDPYFPLSGIHANVINTILTEQFLQELSTSKGLAIEVCLMGVILLLSLRFSSLGFLLGSSVLAMSYCCAVAFFFFFGGMIFPVGRPLLLVASSTVLIITYRYFLEEKKKAVLQKTFEAYFPPAVVKRLVANPDLIASPGQKKELTILFSDIKSFTTYSAALTPHQIQKSLNEYFEAMVNIVFGHQGTVDKYIGDGLMVFFGDPEPLPDHALRCVRAAVDMQKKARELHEKWHDEKRIPIRIRIGINTGEVVVGNMGSARRLSYTVLGSAVNLAQRLESHAPVGGIMISQSTYDLVKEHVRTRPLGQIRVKGIDDPIDAYEVLVDGQFPCESPAVSSPSEKPPE